MDFMVLIAANKSLVQLFIKRGRKPVHLNGVLSPKDFEDVGFIGRPTTIIKQKKKKVP
jgi:hypothetical protein